MNTDIQLLHVTNTRDSFDGTETPTDIKLQSLSKSTSLMVSTVTAHHILIYTPTAIVKT